MNEGTNRLGRGRAAALFFTLLLVAAHAPAQDAEQRAEGLRSQLRDITAKESELQLRLQQLEEDLRPENIQRSIALIGTTRTEELRAQRREQLEREREGVRRQLEDLGNSRARIEAAIARVEAEADRLNAAGATTPPATTTTTPANTTATAPAAGTPAPAAAPRTRRPARRPARRTRRRRG